MATRCAPVPTTLAQRRFNMHVIYDKLVHGRNKRKQTKRQEDGVCPTCKKQETQARILLECCSPRLTLLREVYRRKWRNFRNSRTQDLLAAPLLESLDKLAWSPRTPHVERYWLGTHDSDSWTRLTASCQSQKLDHRSLSKLFHSFLEATRILRQAADAIFTERRSMYWERLSEEQRQSWHSKRSTIQLNTITSCRGFKRLLKTRPRASPLAPQTQSLLRTYQTQMTNYFPFQALPPIIPSPLST